MKRMPLIAGLMTIFSVSGPRAQTPPAADSTVEAAVMQVLKDYADAFNRLDVVAFERTLQFPFYSLAGGRMSVLERQGQQTVEQLRSIVGPEWDHSAWTRLRIIHSSPDKVHVDTSFTRYRKDGSIIGSFESLYIVTKEQGRWGVKLRSVMAP